MCLIVVSPSRSGKAKEGKSKKAKKETHYFGHKSRPTSFSTFDTIYYTLGVYGC